MSVKALEAILVVYVRPPEINAYLCDGAHLGVRETIVNGEVHIPVLSVEFLECKR